MPGLLERDDVANGGDPRNARSVLLVDADVAAFEFQPGFFRTEPARDWTAACCDEQVVRADLRRLAVGCLGIEVDPFCGIPGARDPGAGEHLDALTLERFLELRRDRFVLDRHEPGQQFDNRDLAPEAAENRSEFDANRATSKDHDRLWNLAKADRFVARDDPLAIDLDPGHAPRLRSRGDDDLLPGNEGLPVALRDLDVAFAGEPPGPLDPVDLVLLEENLDPAGQALDDLVLTGLNLVHVDADCRPCPLPGGRLAERDAPFLPVLRDLEGMRVLEQRLRRNAPPVETGAAENGRALDHRCLQAELCGTDGRDVSARPGSDHYDIVFAGHLYSRSEGRGPRPGARGPRLNAEGCTRRDLFLFLHRRQGHERHRLRGSRRGRTVFLVRHR